MLSAAAAQLLIDEFEAGATLESLAAERGLTTPAAALALSQALKVRADRWDFADRRAPRPARSKQEAA